MGDAGERQNRPEVPGPSPQSLLKAYPWLPLEEDSRLHDPALRKNFVVRVFALHTLNASRAKGLTHDGLLVFHSRHKLLLLAHQQPSLLSQ